MGALRGSLGSRLREVCRREMRGSRQQPRLWNHRSLTIIILLSKVQRTIPKCLRPPAGVGRGRRGSQKTDDRTSKKESLKRKTQ